MPDPLSLPKIGELLRGYEETVPQFVNALRPIEWRYTNDPAWVMRDKGERLDHNRVWIKAEGPMPDDPVLHTAALVYSSDTTVLDSIITTHGLSWGFDRIFAATVNHSVWFHRPRSASTTGCCIRRRRRWPRTRAAWAPGISSTNPGKSSPPSCRKASSSTSRLRRDKAI